MKMEMENEKAKYDFLKGYLSGIKCIEVEDAWATLSDFYQTLPEKTKGKERKEYFSMLVEQMQIAFNMQLKMIADCPFVKIEIEDRVSYTKLKEILDYFEKTIQIMTGYLQGNCDMTRTNYAEIKTLLARNGFKTRNFDDLIRKLPEEKEAK